MKTTAFLLLLAATVLGSSALANPGTDAEKELQQAATEHKVKIQVERMTSASNQAATILDAPIQGIERYRDADFAAGAPVLLLIVRSSVPHAIPNGSYVIKVKIQSGATSGKALFVDRRGTVVAQRELIISTRKQVAVLFPDVYSGDGSQDIPVITSVHVWQNNHWYVDCAGWQPYKVLFFSA